MLVNALFLAVNVQTLRRISFGEVYETFPRSLVSGIAEIWIKYSISVLSVLSTMLNGLLIPLSEQSELIVVGLLWMEEYL